MKETHSMREQALHPQPEMKAELGRGGVDRRPPSTDTQAGLDERILTAVRAAFDIKALRIVVLDLREIASFTDYFIIASGTNARQVQAIADSIIQQLKKIGTKMARVEGYQTAEWVLVDYGDFIAHVFEDKARRFYDLERLWRDAKLVALPRDLENGTNVPSEA